MTPLEAIRLVVRRELVERIRQKSLLVSTALTLAIVVAIGVIPGVVGDDGPTTYDVGLVGDRGATTELADALERVEFGDDVSVGTRTVDDRDQAERLVAAGDLDAAIDGDRVIVEEDLGDELGAVLQLAHRSVLTREALDAAGASAQEAAAITDPAPLRTEAIDPPDAEKDDRSNLVNIGVFIVFSQIFGFGFAVASGVVEEKSSRVVEVVLAKVRPAHLLAGKIIGIGLLGFAQLLLFLAVGLGAAIAAGSVDLPPGIVGATALVLAWYVVGFALYSCLFAMAGAVASRVEELQNTSMPIQVVVMAGYFAAIFASGEPEGTVARVASFLPTFAPMVMPIRMVAGGAAWWEIVLSVVLVLVTLVIIVRLAARVYSGGALRTRGKISLRHAYAGTD